MLEIPQTDPTLVLDLWGVQSQPVVIIFLKQGRVLWGSLTLLLACVVCVLLRAEKKIGELLLDPSSADNIGAD